MKTITCLIVAGFLVGTTQSVNAQCSPDEWVSQCIPKLTGDFNFLKSYQIDGQGGERPKIEYSYVFTKGTQYMINICADGAETDGVVVTLFNSDRKQLASSLIDGQYISAIAYPCNSTGIYYLTYTFEDSNKYCGGSVLGFKRG